MATRWKSTAYVRMERRMDILSAGQCAAGNSSAFVPDETIAGDRSTSNADRWICDFYDRRFG